MEKINILAIIESVEKSQSGYERAIKRLASMPCPTGFTSEDVGISGQTLSWLAKYGVLKVIGKKNAFVCIDEYEETYKKVEVNVYAVDCDIVELALAFEREKKEFKVKKIEQRVAKLREQLEKALADLDEIRQSRRGGDESPLPLSK